MEKSLCTYVFIPSRKKQMTPLFPMASSIINSAPRKKPLQGQRAHPTDQTRFLVLSSGQRALVSKPLPYAGESSSNHPPGKKKKKKRVPLTLAHDSNFPSL